MKSNYHFAGGDADRLLARGSGLPFVSGENGALAWRSLLVNEKTVRELWTKKVLPAVPWNCVNFHGS